jgi:hypothetical protein
MMMYAAQNQVRGFQHQTKGLKLSSRQAASGRGAIELSDRIQPDFVLLLRILCSMEFGGHL